MKQLFFYALAILIILVIIRKYPSACDVAWRYDGTYHHLQICGL